MSQRQPFTVGLIQMAMTPAEQQHNLDHAISLIEQAADRGAQVICLPELFKSEYFCQTHDPAIFDYAEEIPGPSTQALGKVAKAKGIVIIASLFEKRARGLYHNTAAVIDADGSLLGVYRKMHIPHDPLFFEKYYFTPGDTGFKVFNTQFAKIGVLVCWDQWFPEGARLTAMQGADILFYPTAIGWHPKEKAEYGAAQTDAWITAQRAHAIANGVYVGSVNRVGFEQEPGTDGLEFWGNSFLADPFGRFLQQGGDAKEEILIHTCDPAKIEETRRWWPFFRDRRIDAYSGLTERFGG